MPIARQFIRTADKLCTLTLRALCCVIALGIPGLALAKQHVTVVYNDNNIAHREFIEHLNIDAERIELSFVTVDEISSLSLAAAAPDLYVTIGSEAAFEMFSRPLAAPVLATLIPKRTYLAAKIGHADASALYVDQPFARKIAMGGAMFGDGTRYGVLIHEHHADLKQDIEHTARQMNEHIVIRTLSDDDLSPGALYKSLSQKISDMDVLIALPDRHIYNSKTIRSILISTYRRKIPVIGFSHSFTVAGALASIYTEPADLGRQAGNIIETFFAHNKRLPPPQFPASYSIGINDAVARSFGLNLPGREALKGEIDRRYVQ